MPCTGLHWGCWEGWRWLRTWEGCTGKGCMGRGCMGRGASPPRTPRGSWLMLLPLPFRLERSLQPGRSRGVTGEGVRIARGVLQAQIPRPAREVSRCWLCPVPQPQNPVLGALQPLGGGPGAILRAAARSVRVLGPVCTGLSLCYRIFWEQAALCRGGCSFLSRLQL